MQPWGWSALGRLLWFLLLVTHSVLVAEVTPPREVAQLLEHAAAAAEQAYLQHRELEGD